MHEVFLLFLMTFFIRIRSYVVLKNKIVCNHHFSIQKNVIFAKTDLIRDESYRLLDSGDGKKLEQFGRYRIVRPSQFSSHYHSRLSDKEWLQYDFKYEITEQKKEGEWIGVDNLENWIVKFNHIRFNLAPHEGGQIGIFPEQKPNWKWLENVVHKFYPNFSDQKPMNILNGFAHTGGSTIACMTQPNVVVTHLDASKTATNDAKVNAAISETKGSVRWIIDDCLTFLNREIRRVKESGNYYHGLIFDPPAYGRADKKTWKLSRDMPVLLELLPQLLDKKPSFILITCHDPEWSAEVLERRLFHILKNNKLYGNFESGNLVIHADQSFQPPGRDLKLGSYVRWSALTT